MKELQQLENLVVTVPSGINDLETIRTEIKNYIDVLLHREPLPVNVGVNSLYEVAVAYYSRGKEIELNIKEMENKGHINRNSPLSKFRTGELAAFLDMAKEQCRLGSRRITVASMILQEKEV